jgi:nicotinamide-nucleotide amidase
VATDLATEVIGRCAARGLTIAVAESLTGGLLVASLVAVPGASAVLSGGVVAYNTALKHTLLGVDELLLANNGAVDPDVAIQMATGVRERLAVGGRPATIGVATTGVAGPDPQDGKPVGTVYLGLAVESRAFSVPLLLSGSRDDIRSAVVSESLVQLTRLIDSI